MINTERSIPLISKHRTRALFIQSLRCTDTQRLLQDCIIKTAQIWPILRDQYLWSQNTEHVRSSFRVWDVLIHSASCRTASLKQLRYDQYWEIKTSDLKTPNTCALHSDSGRNELKTIIIHQWWTYKLSKCCCQEKNTPIINILWFFNKKTILDMLTIQFIIIHLH